MAAALVGSIDPKTQEKLLSDPKVREAMKNAGAEAMKDPKVQQAIKDVAKDMLTAENAQLVANQVKEWANDPEVQAKARHYAGMAMVAAGQAGQMFVGCIEQGPAGVRVLAFIAGVCSLVLCLMTLINPLNALALVSYTVAIYQAIFAVTTMLFEAKPEWVAKIGPANEYQNLLIEYCKFLTLNRGRGAFYIFQGATWISYSSWHEIFQIGTGAFLIFIGALHVAMGYGIMPQEIAAKAKQAAASYRGTPPPENP